MTFDAHKLNPYQPPPTTPGQLDPTAPAEVAFQLTQALDRHAEAQYLLHWHPQRLLFGSLAMIAGSLAILIFAISVIAASFWFAIAFVLTVSGVIYTAMVHRTKQQVRVRQQQHGLTPDAMITFYSEPERISVITPQGTFHWPNHELKVYRAGRGLLICPEPLLYVFIPKQSSFPLESYKQFVRLIESRIPSKT